MRPSSLRLGFFSALVVAACGLAACTSTDNDPAPSARRSRVVDAAPIDAPLLKPGYLWFAGSDLNAFTREQTQASNDAGPAVLVVPSSLTATFHDLTFDSAGNLWTIPIVGDQILRIPRSGLGGDIRPLANLTISSAALKSPQALTFDGAGNLWVVNYNGSDAGVASIVRFDAVRDMAGGTVSLVPSVTIGPGAVQKMIGTFTQGTALAFDKAGNLWFGSVSAVMRFDAPANLHGTVVAAPSAVISTGDAYASIAFDSIGSLWITATKVDYFALRVNQPELLTGTAAATPAARVKLPASMALFAGGMAFDANGGLWIAMSTQIIELARPSGLVGNVSPGADVVLALPSTSYPDLASKLAFWPTPAGLPGFQPGDASAPDED